MCIHRYEYLKFWFAILGNMECKMSGYMSNFVGEGGGTVGQNCEVFEILTWEHDRDIFTLEINFLYTFSFEMYEEIGMENRILSNFRKYPNVGRVRIQKEEDRSL